MMMGWVGEVVGGPPADDDASYLLPLPRRKSFSLCRRRGEGDLLMLLKIRQKYKVFIGFLGGIYYAIKMLFGVTHKKILVKRKKYALLTSEGRGNFFGYARRMRSRPAAVTQHAV